MSAVRTAPPPPVARTRRVVPLLGLLVVAAVFALLLWAVRPPPRIGRLDIVNRSPSPIEVSVAAAAGGGELDLGEAIPRSTTRVEAVVDQGDEWVFRFATATCPPVDVRMSRARLEASGWRLTVPDRVTAALLAGCPYVPPIPAPG